MSSCAVIPEEVYKEFEKELGISKAQIKAMVNDLSGEIPSLDKAKEYIKNLQMEDKDEEYDRHSPQAKILMLGSEINMLEEKIRFIESRSTTSFAKQAEVLKKIIEHHRAYQAKLKTSIKSGEPVNSVSVSTFKGKSNFYGDPTLYTDYRDFGDFMHMVIEDITTGADIINNINNFTQEDFNNLIDKFKKKVNLNLVESMSKEDMYKMALETLNYIKGYVQRGFVIVPEITMTGKAVELNGNLDINARFDIIGISPEGKIVIMDLKTKRTNVGVRQTVTGEYIHSLDDKLTSLVNKDHLIEAVDGKTFRDFVNTNRNTFDEWFTQLQMYNNILEQNGFETIPEHTILALLYEMSDDKKFGGGDFISFNNHDYYNRVQYKLDPTKDSPMPWSNRTFTQEKLDELRKLIDRAIPVKEVVEQENIKRNLEDSYDLRPTDLEAKKLLDYAENNIDKQLEALNKDLSSNTGVNEEINEIKKNRARALMSIKKIINENRDKDKDPAIYRGIMFASTLQALGMEIQSLNVKLQGNLLQKQKEAEKGLKTSKGIYFYKNDIWTLQEYDGNITEVTFDEVVENVNDITVGLLYNYKKLVANNQKEEAIKLYSQIFEIYKQNKVYSELLQILYEIANNVKNNDPSLSPDSAILKNVYQTYSDSEYITDLFRNASIPMIVYVLKSVGETQFKQVKKEINQVMALRYDAITKQIKDLEDGKYGYVQRFAQKVSAIFSKTDKQRLEELKNNPDPSLAYKLEKLMLEKKQMGNLMTGLEYNDESLTKYVEAMNDPNNTLYMGARSLYNSNNLLSNLNPNQFQASITDQDLGIASVMIIMKNAEAMANNEIVNDEVLHKLDKLKDKLLKSTGWSIETLNKTVSQWKTVVYYDRATGLEKSSKDQLFFTRPYTQDYANTYRNHQALVQFHKENVKNLKDKYYQAYSKSDKEAITLADKEYKEAVIAQQKHKKEHIQWLIDNTTLPFKKEWYQLQAALPQKYAEQIQDIYMQMYIVNRTDPSLMDEDDYDKLLILKAEIKKLKTEAKQEDEEYARLLAAMEGMYDPKIDQDRFNAFYKQASLQLANYPEGWEKWKKIYTISRPSQAWYEERAAIYEEMSSMFSQDEELSQLHERKRDLLKPYKGTNGMLNTRLIPSDVIEELDGLDNEIAERIDDLKQGREKLNPEIAQQLSILKNKLNAIQDKKLSPTYLEDLEQRSKMYNAIKKTVLDTTEILKKTQNEEAHLDWQVATKNLDNFIDQYVEWFNIRHIGQTSKEKIYKEGVSKMLSVPKPFNYVFMPKQEKHKEFNLPNPDYFTSFDLKEEATNPDYIESVEHIPMPKGIVKTGKDTYTFDPTQMSSNIDPAFINIKQNSELSEYYDALTSYYFGLQNKMEGVKTTYSVPGFASSLVEDIHALSLSEAAKKRIKLLHDKMFKLRGEVDASENTYGDIDSNIRARFTRQLDKSLQTTDSIGAVYKFATEAHYNKAMQMVKPVVEGFIEYVKDMKTRVDKSKSYDPKIQAEMTKRSKEWGNMLSVLEYEHDKFIKGQTDSPDSREVKKVINNLFMYVSMIRIGFDLTNQVKNYTAGSIQFWIASGKSSKHYTDKDIMLAYKKTYGPGGFLINYFKDWGKISDISESTMLYRIMNPLQKDMIKYVNEITGGKARRLSNKASNVMELGYMVQDKGDTMIGLMTMYSVMNHYKYKMIDKDTKTPMLDADGKNIYVSAHECYYKDENGLLKIRDDVDYTIDDQLFLKRVIIAEMRRAQGNYASSDQTRMERETLGKFMFFFRKFLIPLMLNRFGNLKPSWETGEASLGYWRAFAQAFKYFGPKQALTELFLGYLGEDNVAKIGLKGVGKSIDINDPRTGETITIESKEIYVRKIAQVRRDALAMILLSGLSSLLLFRLKGKEDDDEEISALEGNAVRLVWLTKMEALSMFPFVGTSSQEYVKNFSTVIPFTKEATASFKAIDHMLKYGLILTWQATGRDQEGDLYEEWYKDAFYAQDSGPYEKGTPKWGKDLVDFTGIKNIRDLIQPENRLEQLKGKQ